MIRVFFLLLLAFSATGCVSQMLTERDDAYCRSRGTTPGSKAYFQCRLNKAIRQ